MDNDQHLSVMAGADEEYTMDSGRTRVAMPVFSILPVPQTRNRQMEIEKATQPTHSVFRWFTWPQ